jgi:hypothetical protein
MGAAQRYGGMTMRDVDDEPIESNVFDLPEYGVSWASSDSDALLSGKCGVIAAIFVVALLRGLLWWSCSDLALWCCFREHALDHRSRYA